jgi:titin
MVHVLPGVGELIVRWQAPATTGDGVTSYTVRAFSTDVGSGCTVPADVRSCAIQLGPETTYRVTVAANGRNQTISGDAAANGRYRPLRTRVLPVLVSVPAAAGSLASSAGPKLSAAGAVTTLTGSGYAAHTTVTVTMFSAPKRLGTTTTDGTGAFQVRVTVPVGYSGGHTLVAAGLSPTGTVRYLNLPVTLPAAGAVLPVTGGPVRALVGVGLLLVVCGGLLQVLSPRPVRPVRTPR